MSATSKSIHITSAEQFQQILKSSKAVVADFYADWCGPCKAIAPVYEDFSATYSRKNLVTFTKINSDNNPALSQAHAVTALPTFIYFEDGKEHTRIQGGNKAALNKLIDRWKVIGSGAAESEGSSSGIWQGASLPRGYKDVSDQVDIKGLEMLNYDESFGNARTLFQTSEPTSLRKGKGKAGSPEGSGKDWVESDTDPQLMIHVPFQSTLKVHSLQITSLPPATEEDADDEIPSRPRELRLFINKPNAVGFDEDIEPTQSYEIQETQWDEKTGTAVVDLRFVKFQKVSTLCIFVVDSQGESEKTRIDRIRVIGESGEKREMGKLEKIGDEAGE